MKTTFTLSRYEALALRDQALVIVKNAAQERLFEPHPDHPERAGGTREEIEARYTEELLAAAEVFGAIERVATRFEDVKGLPPAVERQDVTFTERATDWLRSERDAYQEMLEGMRGSCEISEYAPRDTFILWVLAGMFAKDGEG